MKKIYKIILLAAFLLITAFFGLKASAVSPCSVSMGCTGVATLTGIPYGTGVSPLGIVTIGPGLSFTGGTLSSTEHGTVTGVSIASTNGFAGTSSGGATPILTLSTSITGILQGNGTAISAASTTGSGKIVLDTSPSLVTPNIGSATASGLTLSSLTGSTRCLHVNSSGVVSATGGDCAVGSGISIDATPIGGGTTGRILYDNAGVIGEMTTTGSGTVVALATSPSFTTPLLGAATANSIVGIGAGVGLQFPISGQDALNTTSNGTSVLIQGGLGGATSGNGGNINVTGGDSGASGNGGDVILSGGEGSIAKGKIKLLGNGKYAILNTASVTTSDKTFTFPNNTGTIAVTTGTFPSSPGTAGNVLTSDGTNWTSYTTPAPIVRVYNPSGAPFGDRTSRFDVTNTSGTTFRYTWDGTGTNPGISAITFPIGALINISGGQFNVGNQGAYFVKASGANYFEVTNASGVAENDKLLQSTSSSLGDGYIAVSTQEWTKPAGLKYAVIEVQAGGGGCADSTSSSDTTTGGGAGGYAKKTFSASSLAATESLMVGYKGTRFSAANATIAGNSFFKSLATIGGGSSPNNARNTPGGAAYGGDINIAGQASHSMVDESSNGGDSVLGFGGVADSTSTGDSKAGTGYGSGSSGNDYNYDGANGQDGIVIVTEYY